MTDILEVGITNKAIINAILEYYSDDGLISFIKDLIETRSPEPGYDEWESKLIKELRKFTLREI